MRPSTRTLQLSVRTDTFLSIPVLSKQEAAERIPGYGPTRFDSFHLRFSESRRVSTYAGESRLDRANIIFFPFIGQLANDNSDHSMISLIGRTPT